MYQLTQHFATLTELQAHLAAISGGNCAAAVVTAATVGATKPGKPAKTDAPAASSPTAASPPPPVAAPAVKERKYEDTQIGTLLKEAVLLGKKDKALELLGKYNATKDGKPSGQGLRPDQFDLFETELKEIIEKAKAEAAEIS